MTGLVEPARPPIAALLVLCCACLSATVAQEREPSPSPPLKTGHEERVTVVLAEVEILVTDKHGNAIPDLRKDEIEVREGGHARKVAFLESFATPDLSARPTAGPAPLKQRPLESPEGQEAEPTAGPVLPPPPPQRRIVLLFDAYNSRTPDRRRWIEAAREWVESEMVPSDRVSLAVMDRAQVNVVVPFTGRKEVLLGSLSSESIVAGARYHDYMIEIRTLLDDLQTCVSAYEPEMCALSAAQTYLHEWRVRTEQTLGALKRFAGSLAAIPGRKAVLYMSDGLVVDPGEMVTQAVMATFGTDAMSYRFTSSAFPENSRLDMVGALSVASTADVTFFTFDTRRSSMRDVSWMAEERVALHERRAMDPFAMMFDGTRASLDTMAFETGGRSYHGPSIEKNLPKAIGAIEGLYTVGYYRDATVRGEPKIKVKIARKGTVVTYPKKAKLKHHEPLRARLELAVATPKPQAEGLLIPLLIQIPLKDMSFATEGERSEAELALYAEALSVTGERVADAFQMVEVGLARTEYERSRYEGRFSHTLDLVVPPGAYRLRVRVSESDFTHGAERTLDVTVNEDGTLAKGIQESGSVQ